jgi:hypothetical protein
LTTLSTYLIMTISQNGADITPPQQWLLVDIETASSTTLYTNYIQLVSQSALCVCVLSEISVRTANKGECKSWKIGELQM